MSEIKESQVWYSPQLDTLLYIYRGADGLYIADQWGYINVLNTTMSGLVHIGEL
jgi:hypothetical protein